MNEKAAVPSGRASSTEIGRELRLALEVVETVEKALEDARACEEEPESFVRRALVGKMKELVEKTK